jgi:drug/metabolite transporter (DMT)-like permease
MTDRSETKLWFELCLLGLLALLWGSSYLFLKVAVETIPPLTLIAIRVSVAAIFLMMVMTWRQEKLPREKEIWGQLFVQSNLNSICAWTLLAWGQQYVASSLSSVLNSTSPIFVFFLTLFVTRHEATNGLRLIGACFGVAGVVLIVGFDAFEGLGQQVVAQLAVLLSAFLYAIAAIYGKRFADVSPTVVATGTMIWASVCLIPASLIFEQPWTLQPSLISILAALTLAVFCTGCALLIYFRLIQTLGSLGVTSQSYLRAGVGVLLGVFLLGEHITPIIGLGLLFAIIGVAAINLPNRKRASESSS